MPKCFEFDYYEEALLLHPKYIWIARKTYKDSALHDVMVQ